MESDKPKEFNLYSRPPNSRTSYPFYDPAVSINQVELTPRPGDGQLSSRSQPPEPLGRVAKPRKPVILPPPQQKTPRPAEQPKQQPLAAQQPKPIFRYQSKQMRDSDLNDWPNNFSYHFCNCCEDFKLCALAFCFLPCLTCCLYLDVKEGWCSGFWHLMQCGLPCSFCCTSSLSQVRTKVRSTFRIRGNTIMDYIASTCCPICTTIQLYSELIANREPVRHLHNQTR